MALLSYHLQISVVIVNYLSKKDTYCSLLTPLVECRDDCPYSPVLKASWFCPYMELFRLAFPISGVRKEMLGPNPAKVPTVREGRKLQKSRLWQCWQSIKIFKTLCTDGELNEISRGSSQQQAPPVSAIPASSQNSNVNISYSGINILDSRNRKQTLKQPPGQSCHHAIHKLLHLRA